MQFCTSCKVPGTHPATPQVLGKGCCKQCFAHAAKGTVVEGGRHRTPSERGAEHKLNVPKAAIKTFVAAIQADAAASKVPVAIVRAQSVAPVLKAACPKKRIAVSPPPKRAAPNKQPKVVSSEFTSPPKLQLQKCSVLNQ
jgi:hypothetical protein